MWAALLGRPYIFVRPLGRTFLYNLPFWIKITAQNWTRNLSVCRAVGHWSPQVGRMGGEGRGGQYKQMTHGLAIFVI